MSDTEDHVMSTPAGGPREKAGQEEDVYLAWNTASSVIRCAKLLKSAPSFEEGIQAMLEEIFSMVRCDRVYILQVDCVPHRVLYECNAPGVVTATEIFQGLASTITTSFTSYVCDYEVMILQIEDLKEVRPEVYKVMSGNGLVNTLTAPLYVEKTLFGNFAIDNFDPCELVNLREFAQALSFFLAAELATSRLVKKLRHLSNTDLLTGALNRNAMNDKITELKGSCLALGVLYADINGLKATNDQLGHEAGDKLIKRSAGALVQVFDRQYVYRAGGDEFIVLMEGVTEKAFLDRVRQIQTILSLTQEFSMAIGYAYSESVEDPEELIRSTDSAMYADKEAFYEKHGKARRT